MAMVAMEAGIVKQKKGGRPRFRNKIRFALRKAWLKWSGVIFILASLYMAYRQFRLLVHVPDTLPPQPPPLPMGDNGMTGHTKTIPSMSFEDSVNLWRKVGSNLPPEIDAPNPDLYGMGKETCFSIGRPDHVQVKPGDPAAFWQMNSRALCYLEGGGCWYGRSLEHLMTFEKRGTGKCLVVGAEKGDLLDARERGLNESCAKWRERQVTAMYGKSMYSSVDEWNAWVQKRAHKNPRHHTVQWESNFAIVVPKFEWSYNICHYNRIWNFIIYVIRNLPVFVPDADKITNIDVMFRSGYTYHEHWHVGIRNATLPVLEQETGKKIKLRKLRYDSLRDFQCIRRGIVLGSEGRIDAFPFFNDTDVWHAGHQKNDSHWPVIPHDSLWLREVMMQASGLPSLGKYSGPGINHFESIPLPPRRVGFLQRSKRSRRRLSSQGQQWFEEMLEELCAKHQMELVHVRTNSAQSLVEQVKVVHRLGMAVGLHGANIVNSMFIAPAGALFEIFPWRYVRFYYAAGGNAGLRYSFHEPEGGIDRSCSFKSKSCFMRYRESMILLTDRDRTEIRARIEKAMRYIVALHRRYPGGSIPLRRKGNVYHFDA